MNKDLKRNHKLFLHKRRRGPLLQKFFNSFLSEAVYRSTKIEHPRVSRKGVFPLMK